MNDKNKGLKRLAEINNVTFINRGNGHIQLIGKRLVNYYPESKNQTLHIAGNKHGATLTGVSLYYAVRLSLEVPENQAQRDAQPPEPFKLPRTEYSPETYVQAIDRADRRRRIKLTEFGRWVIGSFVFIVGLIALALASSWDA